MKRLILSASLVLVGLSAIAPAAFANRNLGQVSTREQLSETATFHDLIRHNRDARSSK